MLFRHVLYQLSYIRILVYRENFEISTLGLRVPCSSSELPVHYLEDTLTNTISGQIGLFYVAA